MQPGGAGSVQAEPAQQDHAGNGIGGLRQTRPGQVVMHKPLGDEPAEEPLDDPMLQVEVDHAVVHRALILEHDRPDWRRTAPFPPFLVPGPRRPQGVHGVGPGGIGPFALIEGGEYAPRRPAVMSIDRLERLGSHQFQGTGDRQLEMLLVEADARLRFTQLRAEPVDLLA